MRINRALLAATLVAAAAGLTGVAHAWVPPTGPTCSLAAVPDPQPEAPTGGWTGILTAGPLVANGTTMTVTCSVQVGGLGLHTDPDVQVRSEGPAANAVTLGSGVDYVNPGTTVWVCTEVHQVDQFNVAEDLYWDAPTQTWALTPVGTFCAAVPTPAAAVYGGIEVVYLSSTFTAAFQAIPFGVLADPNQWTCTTPTFVAGSPYEVTCTPVNALVPWSCELLHVKSFTVATAATLRTSVDCDGDAVPEAQTATASGFVDSENAFAVAGVPATSFTCRLDDGGASSPVPSFSSFCYDPGLGSVR